MTLTLAGLSHHQLTLSFRWRAGEKWKGTYRQWEALNAEAENLGFNAPDFYKKKQYENKNTPSFMMLDKELALGEKKWST